MTKVDEIVSKYTDGPDENLPGEEEKEDKKPDTPEKPDESPAEGKDAVDDDKKPDDDGYTADELEADEEEKEEDSKSGAPATETPDIDTSGMDAETRFIVENLPYVTARIKQDGTVKEVRVKSWTQLPEDLEFATKRDELAFVNALQAQENRAVNLQQQFQQQKQQKESKEFQEKENNAIRADIARLQKSGDIPKFKVDPDSADFAKDEATKEVQKIIDYMEDRNKQYLAEYQQGRPFKHIGFEEAFYMYQRKNVEKKAQDKEDEERKGIADKVGSSGTSSKNLKKPTVKSGTRLEDILNRVEAEW